MTDAIRSRTTELLSALNTRGLSAPAANWVARALHPPADHLGPVHFPDATFRPVVPMVTRPSLVVSAPPGLAEGATWDLCVINFPGDAVAAHFCAAPAGTDFAGPGVPAAPFYTGVLPSLPSTPGGLRFTTIDTGATLRDYIAPGIETDHCSYRVVASSCTMYMTASSLYDGGVVTSGQVNAPPVTGCGYTDSVPHPPLNYFGGGLSNLFCLPLNEAQMNNEIPGVRVAPAKEGTYLPLRLMGPTVPFVSRPAVPGVTFWSTTGNLLSWGVDTNSLYTTTLPIVAMQNGNVDTQVGWLRSLVMTKALPAMATNADSAFGNLATGVTIFRGLDQRATITLRMFMCYELIPRATSPLRSLVVNGPGEDQLAVSTYYNLVKSMPVAYPARDNGLGLLLPKLMSALRFLGPIVMPHVLAAAKDVAGAVMNRKEKPKAKQKARPTPQKAN